MPPRPASTTTKDKGAPVTQGAGVPLGSVLDRTVELADKLWGRSDRAVLSACAFAHAVTP